MDYKKHSAYFGAILALVIIFGSSYALQSGFFSLSQSLSVYLETKGILGPAVFVALACLSVMLGPFTSAPLVPLSVALWGTDRTLLFLLLGWLSGNCVAYLIGLKLARPAALRLLEKNKSRFFLQLLPQKLSLKTALLFRLATPSETGYVFGTLRYNFFKYFFVTFIAELPFAAVTVYASEAFLKAGWPVFLALGAVWLALIYGAVHLLKKEINAYGQTL